MNKLFTKVAALTLGVAMAAGVGVAVGASQKASSVEAGYEIATSIAVGDTVVFAYSNGQTKKELKQISLFGTNYVGEVADYTDSVPNAVYPLTVEAGTADGSFAFKDAANKYLVWESGNTLNHADAITDNSSWKISDVSGVSLKLTNVKDTSRKLQYNTGNPRFATYTSSQAAFNIFKYVEEGGDTYTIKYLPNGGDGKMSPTTSSNPLVADCEFTAPDGKRFSSWNTQEDGKGDTYAVGASVSEDISLYAIWEDIPEYTCAQAIAQIDASGDTKNVYVSGYVTNYETEVSGGKLSYWMADTADGGKVFEVYLGYGLDGKEFTSQDELPLGSQIKVYCSLTKYKEIYETVSGSKIVSLVAPEKELSSIVILGEMTKVEYLEGDPWNPDGLVVNATFDDQSVQDVSDKVEWSYNPATAESTEVKSVTVTASYTFKQIEKTDSVEVQVTVSEKPAAKDTYNLDGTKQVIAATRDGVTHYLKENGASNAPLSVATVEEATVFELALVADDTFEFAVSDDSGKSYLYATAANNGLRFGSGDAVQWKIEEGYQPTEGEARGGAYDIYATDSKGDSRYITLYDGSGSFDWRVYKTPDAQNRLENIDLVEVGEPPVEVKYEVSFYEGNTGGGTQYAEGAKVIIPQPTESLIPEGKEFDYWEHKETGDHYAPGDEFIVGTSSARFDAVYKDKAPNWSDAQKEALETALHGYLPPYFGELEEDLATTESTASFLVAGDFSENLLSMLGDGWTIVSADHYVKEGTTYYLTASIYIEKVRGLPVGDHSRISFAYFDQALSYDWTAQQKLDFASEFDGVVPPYISLGFVGGMQISTGSNSAYGEVAGIDQTQLIKNAFDNDELNWVFHEESETEYPGYDLETTNGSIKVGYYYESGVTWISLQYIATPTSSWSEDQINAFNEKLKVVPPCFSDEVAEKLVWDEQNEIFIAEGLTGNQQNAIYTALTGAGWTYKGQTSSGNVCSIAVEGGTAYAVFSAYYTDDTQTTIATDIIFYMQKTVTKLAVDTTGGKTEYVVGQSLDTTGYVVYGIAADETVVGTIPATSCTFSPSTFSETGEIEVTVTCNNWSGTFKVTVVPVAVQSVVVSGSMTKTSYNDGDSWDSTGLVATAIYNNGNEEDVTSQVEWSFDPEKAASGVESVAVVATLGDVASTAYNVEVTVAAAYGADEFAKDLLEMVAPICNNYDGKKNNKVALKGVWDTMSQRYSTLSNEEKAKVIAAAAKADGTDLEKAMAFYNYACKKYGLAKFIEGRQVKALVAEHETGNSILPIVVIVASSVAAITAIGVVIALKRRKALLAK